MLPPWFRRSFEHDFTQFEIYLDTIAGLETTVFIPRATVDVDLSPSGQMTVTTTGLAEVAS